MPRFKKPGYTQIPNEIFDKLMPQLTGAELKVLLLISRKTLGFHKDCEALGVDRICDGTGLSRQGVIDAIASLVKDGWIEKESRTDRGKSLASLYSLSFEETTAELGVQKVDPSNAGVQNFGSNFLGAKNSDPLLGKETEPIKETNNTSPTPSNPQSQNQNPFNPESLTKLLCQKFKRLKGVSSFNATARDIVARSSNMLDAGLSEDQVVELFDRWAQEDFWREFDTPHKVRSFFSWVKTADVSHASIAADSPTAPPTPRTARSTPSPVDGPVGLPTAKDYPALWNELVPEKPTDPILFATVNPKVWKVAGFAERFEDICRKARELLKAGVDVNLLRLIKDFGSGIYGWQEMLAGAMDPKKNGKPAPKVSGEDWQVAKARRIAREKEEAERAASTKVST